MKPFEMTEEFHRVFDSQGAKEPTAFSMERGQNRVGFKIEELVEFLYATSEGDQEVFEKALEAMHQGIEKAKHKIQSKALLVEDPLVEQVDALTDLLYFIYGSFSLMGVDPEPMMAIVHQANMGKLFPDGQPHYDPITKKVLKPDQWERDFSPEAKIRAELNRQLNK